MNALLVRLDKSMDTKQENKDNFGVHIEEKTVGTDSESQEDYHSVDEVETSKESQLVSIATLKAVNKGCEFVESNYFEDPVNDPMFAETTEGEELEGERVQEEDQGRDDGDTHYTNDSRDSIDEVL